MSYAIILGDPHLGKGQLIGKSSVGATLNSRIADQVNLLDWTLDYAVDKSADDIIITGDIFEDPKPPPYLITLFISWLKRCQAHNVRVHIIRGNHDILRSGHVYNSPLDIVSEIDLDGISVYKDVDTIIIGTTAFTMLPFRDRKSFNVNTNDKALSLLKESLSYELASIPLTYKKVLIGHLAIEGSIPIGDEIDDITNELFCPLNMFNGYDYVWMGHVHKPQIMQKELGKPFIAHIGSMDTSNFGETDHLKHIIIFDCSGNDKQLFSLEDLPTRSLRKINITIPKDTIDTTAYVINSLEKYKGSKAPFDKAIVKVEVSLETPELISVNKSTIEKYLTDNGAFNIAGISESKKVNLVKRDTNNTIDTKMDVSSAMKTYADTYVDAKIKTLFIEAATEIYSLYKSELKE